MTIEMRESFAEFVSSMHSLYPIAFFALGIATCMFLLFIFEFVIMPLWERRKNAKDT